MKVWNNAKVKEAIEKLGNAFQTLNWSFIPENISQSKEIVSYWPGEKEEDVMVCVLKDRHINEQFHRQDFFFLNFAYQQNYQALSVKSDNLITVKENDCYIGQPFSGYALKGDSEEDIVIIGILIQKETFFQEYLSALSADDSIFHFFLDPQSNEYSDAFIHLSFPPEHPLHHLLELMVLEYADKSENSQAILKSLTLTILMYIAQEYHKSHKIKKNPTLSDEIIQYINQNLENVSLNKIAEHFSYHPNYISSVLHEKTGKTFTEILTKQRMERALALLRGTNLSVEKVANMVGYSSSSNFYRAFKKMYSMSPKEYLLLKD